MVAPALRCPLSQPLHSDTLVSKISDLLAVLCQRGDLRWCIQGVAAICQACNAADPACGGESFVREHLDMFLRVIMSAENLTKAKQLLAAKQDAEQNGGEAGMTGGWQADMAHLLHFSAALHQMEVGTST
jgi:hypothetical protein